MSVIDINETNFGSLITQLREQIERLKQRCVNAETAVAALSIENRLQKQQIAKLTDDNKAITEQYQNLKAGTANGASPEEVEQLRNRYLAMIREIDDCIDKLNGR